MNRENFKDNLKIALMLSSIVMVVVTPVTIASLWLTAQITLPTTGITATANLELTHLDGSPQTTLAWGVVDNGTHNLHSILKNIGNVALSLAMSTDPTETWLAQDWNCTSYVLQPNQQVEIEWLLTVTDAPQGIDFSYTTTIMGTEI